MILLDPYLVDNHSETALTFLRHFKISPFPRDMDLIKNILFHFSLIPYENLSKRIKMNTISGEWDRLRLPEEVFNSFLSNKFGGTCYSLTYFLWSILSCLGYKSNPVTMDMKWGKNAHCGLILSYDKIDYLLDPGYLLSKPIPLARKESIHTRDQYTGVQLVYDRISERYSLFTYNHSDRTYRYSFNHQNLSLEDFLIAWKASFYQKSNRHLCLTKIDHKNNGRIYIRDQFIRYYSNGKKENIKMNAKEGVEHFFGISSKWLKIAERTNGV